MNRLPARVTEIRINEGVCRIGFESRGASLSMVGLEPPAGLAVGREVELGIKATHLILSRHAPEETTLSNRLPVRCTGWREGEILASVMLEFREIALEAIVPHEALERLSPRKGEALYASFQAAELSIVSLEREEGR